MSHANLIRQQLVRFAFCGALALGACTSGDDTSEDESSYAEEESPVDDFASEPPEGWRPGRLEVSIDINQEGGSSSDGSTIDWAFQLSAQSSLDVYVPENLSIELPPTGTPDEIRSAYASPPFTVTDLDAEPTATGSLSYQSTFRSETPDSIDVVSMDESTIGTGQVYRLTVSDLHPSIFGSGYDARIELEFSLPFTFDSHAVMANGQRVEQQEEGDKGTVLGFDFYPAPGTQLAAYPYDTEGLPAELRDTERSANETTLSLLRNLASGSLPLSDTFTGATTTSNEDEFVLLYEHQDGTRLVPLVSGTEGLTGANRANRLRLEIRVVARE